MLARKESLGSRSSCLVYLTERVSFSTKTVKLCFSVYCGRIFVSKNSKIHSSVLSSSAKVVPDIGFASFYPDLENLVLFRVWIFEV